MIERMFQDQVIESFQIEWKPSQQTYLQLILDKFSSETQNQAAFKHVLLKMNFRL